MTDRVGISYSNIGPTLKVSNRMARHIVNDICSTVSSDHVRNNELFDHQRFNPKLETTSEGGQAVPAVL